jgi:transposase InsO family protein
MPKDLGISDKLPTPVVVLIITICIIPISLNLIGIDFSSMSTPLPGNQSAILLIRALQMAFWRKKPASGVLHHSDRGSQYASYEYRQHLDIMQMQQSMSRKGNCWDNAPTERFFRSLKHEELNYNNFRTKEAAKLSIIDYLAFYNGKRTHSKLGYQSPLQFEREFYRKVS